MQATRAGSCANSIFGDEERRFFVSITYLRFAGAVALSREIAAYQRHRFKRLRRQLAG
jgi:hypothetical protein